MSRKKTILIFSAFVVLIALLSILLSVGMYKAEFYPQKNKTHLLRRIKNPNTAFNVIKPNAAKLLKQGDLIIHKNPTILDKNYRQKENYCSRIIGLPGDIVKIENTQVYVNDVLFEGDFTKWFLYRVSTQEPCVFEDLLKGFDVEILQILNEGKACEIVCSKDISELISKLPEVINIRKIILESRRHDINMFSSKGNTAMWNPDNIGPVVVPQKDLTVMINPRNIGIYKYIIDFCEDNDLFFSLTEVKVNNELVESYTIKKNYYFVLNDNRYNRNDSRIWGFIPEDQIIGKVIN